MIPTASRSTVATTIEETVTENLGGFKRQPMISKEQSRYGVLIIVMPQLNY
jgi:hypothetical protein